MKNSELILCSGIKMDRNYENVLSYSESNMVSLCRANKIYEANKYTFLGNTDYIDISCPYSTAMYANYVAFINPHFGNKWIFAWVVNVKLLNLTTSRIYIEIDVWSTWYDKFNVGKAFVEREHVSDDTFGLHTVPENLETGEMVINTYDALDDYASEYLVVVGVTKLPSEIYSIVLNNSGIPTKKYNGIYSGLIYVAFKTYDDATKFLLIMDGQGLSENVYNVFIIPKSLVTILNNEWSTTSCSGTISIPDVSVTFNITFSINYKIVPNSDSAQIMVSNYEIIMNSTLDGYTPKNNKMFTGEFNYLHATNNNGGEVKYNFEDFYNATPTFSVLGALCTGGSIRLIPINYKNYEELGSSYICNPYGLSGGKYPTCSWTSDAYTNWITQQSVNISADRFTSLGTTALASAINPVAGAISGLSGGFGMIADAIKRDHQKEYMPVNAKGNVNTGDVVASMGFNQFIIYTMSCRYEFAKKCDEYLSRFGYKINEVKTPNLNSRTQFNFVKVGGMDELISGNIPANALEKINAIFRKGVTIFHSYTNFGNYTIDNPNVET